MTVLGAFYSTWDNARQTYGQGTPQTGEQYDNSSTLRSLESGLEAAAPGSQWSGSAATKYDAANTEHRRVIGELAGLDQQLKTRIDQSAEVVSAGRRDLENLRKWVADAAATVPQGPAGERMQMAIAQKGFAQLQEIIQRSNAESNTIAAGMRELDQKYQALGTDQKFAQGDEEGDAQGVVGDEEKGDKEKKDKGDEAARSGAEDGQALADQAALPPAQRDPEVLDRVAANLPQSPLTQAQMDALADGKEVSDVPKGTLDYYREFYQTAGKDGLLTLDRHLESQEAAGNTDAGSQRDRLANGLTVTSNENVVERNPDGTVASRGGYDQLPPDLREMLETRRADPTYPGWETLGPTEAKNRHVADVVQFGELLGEANPGYQPGSLLGTELYLKSADMVGNSTGGWGMTDTPPEAYERAASSLAEVAGRNNEASYQIWSGNGDDLPEGYNREETVRTLIGHDWSQSGGEGSGAATLLDWITEDSQRPIGDPLGDRARQALVEVPDMLAPSDNDPVWASQRDAFAHNDAIATEMSQLLAANTEALSAPGQQFGFPETKLDPNGHPLISADDADRLLELGSYSEEGRVTLTTAAETARINELETAMRSNPGDLSREVANSAAGGLSGRIDNSITDALNHQNEVLGNNEANNPKDALYRAKVAGAEIAGVVSNELINRIPGSGPVTDVTGLDPGEVVENKIRGWIGSPEYQETTVPDPDNMRASSTLQVQQTVLQAAYEAGQLDPALQDENGPVKVAALYPDDEKYRTLQEFLIDRGLSQYVTDYGQTYSIALGADNSNTTDGGGR